MSTESLFIIFICCVAILVILGGLYLYAGYKINKLNKNQELNIWKQHEETDGAKSWFIYKNNKT